MILPHKDIPTKKGYYSKVVENRMLVSSEVDATTFSVQEQTLPPRGYIALHYHEYEESLTFLTGRVSVMLDNQTSEVEAPVTIFIPPLTKHSVKNVGEEPAKLIAVHGTAEPKVFYPYGKPEPVQW